MATETNLLDRETGDPTYKDRVARFQYVMQRLSETPRPTYDQIGKELGGLSRQNIARLVKRGTVRPAGRQPTNEGRKKRLQARIDKWQARLDSATTEKSKARAMEWISALQARIDALD